MERQDSEDGNIVTLYSIGWICLLDLVVSYLLCHLFSFVELCLFVDLSLVLFVILVIVLVTRNSTCSHLDVVD